MGAATRPSRLGRAYTALTRQMNQLTPSVPSLCIPGTAQQDQNVLDDLRDQGYSIEGRAEVKEEMRGVDVWVSPSIVQ